MLCVKISKSLRLIFLLLPLSGLSSCSGVKALSGGSNNSAQGSCSDRASLYSTPTIDPYCSTVTNYSGGITVNGSATYQYRQIDASGSSPGLLGASSATAIRYAEIRVTDNSGNIIQCGETDASGDYSLALPNSGETYTLSVMARGNNSQVNTAIFECPEEGTIYSLSQSFVADGSKTLSTMNAGVTDDVLGGAFNIYDQILKTNEFLRTEVGTCGFTGCTDFDVAPASKVYWAKGFNPATYFGSSSGVSFFTVHPNDPTDRRLFILGGSQGDVDNEDTDHFDNSVIIHEYGHFLEDAYSISDSPGGSHSGTSLIDPRLAWSEGWANFLQGYVQNLGYYIDTYGNEDGATGNFFRIDLENQSGGNARDVPLNAGEGNFREFSVTRILWDAVDSSTDGGSDTVSGTFNEIWAAMTDVDGMNNTDADFQSIGLLHDAQQNEVSGSTDWSSIRTLEMHTGDRSEYAQYVTQSASECVGGGSDEDYSMTPDKDQTNNGSATDIYNVNTHYLINNDFYHYKHSGGTLSLTLNYTTQSGTSEADLDVYVYGGDAVIGYIQSGASYYFSSDLLNTNSGFTEPDGTVGTSETESVSLSGLAAGDYLIQVIAYVSDGAGHGVETKYNLKVGANYLCPAALP